MYTCILLWLYATTVWEALSVRSRAQFQWPVNSMLESKFSLAWNDPLSKDTRYCNVVNCSWLQRNKQSVAIFAKNRFLQASVEISKAWYFLRAIPELILRTFTGVTLNNCWLGYCLQVDMYLQSSNVPVTITKLMRTLDKNGDTKIYKPRYVINANISVSYHTICSQLRFHWQIIHSVLPQYKRVNSLG